jgi:hypothetical protein
MTRRFAAADRKLIRTLLAGQFAFHLRANSYQFADSRHAKIKGNRSLSQKQTSETAKKRANPFIRRKRTPKVKSFLIPKATSLPNRRRFQNFAF